MYGPERVLVVKKAQFGRQKWPNGLVKQKISIINSQQKINTVKEPWSLDACELDQMAGNNGRVVHVQHVINSSAIFPVLPYMLQEKPFRTHHVVQREKGKNK